MQELRIPQSQIVDANGYMSQEWLVFFNMFQSVINQAITNNTVAKVQDLSILAMMRDAPPQEQDADVATQVHISQVQKWVTQLILQTNENIEIPAVPLTLQQTQDVSTVCNCDTSALNDLQIIGMQV